MIPPQVRNELLQRLEGATRIAVLGVGSTLRADDAAGILACEALAEILEPPDKVPGEVTTAPSAAAAEVFVFFGHTAPENLTGEIRAFAPSHLLMVDAADFGRPAGEVAIIEPHRINANLSASTHSLPLNVVADYLRSSCKCDVAIIGIQPASHEFNQDPSPVVRQASLEVARLIAEVAGVQV